MLTLGSTLFASSILATALLALLFRRPSPPRWTRPDLVAMLVSVPVAALMALGLGYTLLAIYQFEVASDLDQLAGALAAVLVAAGIWHLLDVRARLRAYASAGEKVVEHPSLTGANAQRAGLPEQPLAASHLRAA